MIATRQALEWAWVGARQLAERRVSEPVRYIRWLPLQMAFLLSVARVKQIRAGNQTIGKTWAALAEVVGRCLGRHPIEGVPHNYRVPPIEAWVICASWSQSLGIQKKLNALLPWPEVSERTSYDEVSGFTPTKSPVVLFRNGSIIRIKTTGQDAIDFAGATIAVVLFDEPPKQPRMYTEALMRLEELGGTLLLSYTPVNAPTDYLKKLVEAGQIEDHWRRLTPEELIPVGCTEPLRAKDGRPKDKRWIEEREAKVPEHERDVVVHGEWEGRAVGAYFDGVYRPDLHITAIVLDGQWDVFLGFDHGHRPGKQVALLILVQGRMTPHPRVHVLDEYIDETGHATPDDDARAILAMLGRHNLRWYQVDEAHGDRVHMKGTPQQKSNRDLSAAIARELDVPRDDLRPFIATVKRGEGHGSGSLSAGSRWLFHAMARPGQLTVHPRCRHGAQRLPKYTLVDDDAGCKDWVDALRYGIDSLIFPTWRRPAGTVRFSP